MAYRVILADNCPAFMAGLVRFLTVEDDISVAGQCDTLPKLYKSVDSAKGAVIVFSSSMKPDLDELASRARAASSRLVVVLEKRQGPEPYLRQDIQGIVHRDVTEAGFLDCVRSVGRGVPYLQPGSYKDPRQIESEEAGQAARRLLSPKELQVTRLVVQGFKNREVAEQLSNTEQVIKNYLRSIYDKTGVSDRFELVLFTMHHKLLF